ncbi:MAG: GNAT family N-acetyltransferase [Bacteroidetes bacterium]|nr:GNAT family N-acetyltransferase [Bacteroidota bacterium]
MMKYNFTPFPILITERLTLRQLSNNDQQSIFDLRSDPEVNKYLDRKVPASVEEALAFINKVNENIKCNTSVYWAITLTETGAFAGTICLYDFSADNNTCEMGYELMTSFQGQGLMREAAEKVIAYAFETLQFKKIVAFTHTHHQRSAKLLAGFNFVLSIKANHNSDDLDGYTLVNSN